MTFEQFLPWIGFHIFLAVALVIDLGVFNRESHEIKFREAIAWCAVWAILAMIFNLGILHFKGQASALEFLAGYVIEWSLSVDNLFVFLTIFSAFSVPKLQQHRVLFWGILGALVMRALFIFAGITLLAHFHWIIYIFGGFLLFTGIKLAFTEKKEEDPRHNWLVRHVKKWLPFTDAYHGKHFFIKNERGRRLATPLLLVLIVVEATDLVFATDSIPAILAITPDPFIVYTSNVFAILGLRSLYFALAGMMAIFHYLRYGLAVILVFVGIKLCISEFYQIPTLTSLLVIMITLSCAIIASLLVKPTQPPNSPSSY